MVNTCLGGKQRPSRSMHKNISWSQLSEQYGKGKARIFQDQFSKFVDGGLSTCVMHVTDPLSKNKLPVFHHAVNAPTNGKLQLHSMKSDRNLVSRLLMCLVRQHTVTWISSSVMKIMLAHYLCHWEALGGNRSLGSNIYCLVLNYRQQHQKHLLWLIQHFWTVLLWSRC